MENLAPKLADAENLVIFEQCVKRALESATCDVVYGPKLVLDLGDPPSD